MTDVLAAESRTRRGRSLRPRLRQGCDARPADGGHDCQRRSELRRNVVAAIGLPTFRPYFSDDLIGAEIGGAVKNVIAIACGVAEGRKLGEGARAALITRGFAEMTRLGLAMGAKVETMNGLCGLGDLVLTCVAHIAQRFARRGAGRGARAEAFWPSAARSRKAPRARRPLWRSRRSTVSICRSAQRSMRLSPDAQRRRGNRRAAVTSVQRGRRMRPLPPGTLLARLERWPILARSRCALDARNVLQRDRDAARRAIAAFRNLCPHAGYPLQRADGRIFVQDGRL